jgi:PDZ domain
MHIFKYARKAQELIMLKLKYVVVFVALIAQPINFAEVANAQLTGYYSSPQGYRTYYSVPGASHWHYIPSPNRDESEQNQQRPRNDDNGNRSRFSRAGIRKYLLQSNTAGGQLTGRQILEYTICETNGKNASIDGHQLTANDVALFREELGCAQLNSNNKNPIQKTMGTVMDTIKNSRRSALPQNQPLVNQSNSSGYQPKQSAVNTKTQPEQITGVGLQLEQDKKTKKLIVVAPINGTPAASSGILSKDAITQIDGVSTQGMTVEQASKLIQGTAGTDVTLIVSRNGKPSKFRLTRVQFTLQAQKNKP